MTRPFKLLWDHTSGNVEILLPSRSRLQFPRESTSFLWAFCNALTILAKRDPEFPKMIISSKEFRKIYARWRQDGNKALADHLAQWPEWKRNRLTDEQLETMRQGFLSAGNVVIKKPEKPPGNLKLADVVKLDMGGLKI